jgi:hypothetical protein
MGRGAPEELMRKTDSEPVVIMADLHLLQECIVGGVDRRLDEILPGPWRYRDRPAPEVVYDNMPYAFVGVCDAHRTHP